MGWQAYNVEACFKTPMEQNPTLSIIVLNYRQKDFCDRCLQSIFSHPIAVPFEVIVIDNASGDNSVEFLHEKWSTKARIIANESNEGFGKGHNKAIKEAKGSYICIMNPDIEVHENTLNLLLEYLKTHEECGIVGPQLIYPDGTIQDSYRRFPTFWDLIIKRTFLRPLFKRRMHHYLMHNVDQNKTQEVDWMVGAFLLISKDFFQALGGFDERYFLFMEDTDLCRKAWNEHRSVVYFPQAKAAHHHARLSGSDLFTALFKKTFYYHIASAWKYFRKWRKSAMPRQSQA